jgi:hypothetical protein
VTWRYSQSTGELSRDGIFLCRGYAGHGPGLNNPEMESVHDIGPIPKGTYRMVAMVDSPTIGPRAIMLVPEEGTQTYGRDSFRIHGDSLAAPGAKDASHGCIVAGRIHRELIWGTKDNVLEVGP